MANQFAGALMVLLTLSSLPISAAQNITWTVCGTSKFCASQPAACDPSMGGSCFFASSVSISGQTLAFQLAGQSDGYIALGLSLVANEGGNITTYVCANENSSVLFSSNLLNNNVLTSYQASSANFTQGSVNGSSIQCTFSATVPNATTVNASSATTFYLFIFNGTFINRTLGNPSTVLQGSIGANNFAIAIITPASNSTSTNATSTNATSSNATSTNATSSNATSTNATSSNATSTNATSSNATSTNATSSNATSTNATSSNATSSNATVSNAASTNATVSNATASNATASNTTTTSSPYTTALNINSTGCGTSRFCVSEPANCDPSTTSNCFFASSALSSEQSFSFQLSGQSTGFIALGLFVEANRGGNGAIYYCAKYNDSVQFSAYIFDSNQVTIYPVMSASLTQGSVSGSSIRCTFLTTLPNASASKALASKRYRLSIFNGTSINGTPGDLNAVFVSASAVNVSNPSSTTTNTLTAKSTGSGPLLHSLSQALLIVLGVLGLAML